MLAVIQLTRGLPERESAFAQRAVAEQSEFKTARKGQRKRPCLDRDLAGAACVTI